MLKKAIFISLFCLLSSFKVMASEATEADSMTLDQRIIAGGASLGFLIGGSSTAIASTAISLPAAGISVIVLPIYSFVNGERKEALKLIYLGPAGILAFSSLAGGILGGITGAIYGGLLATVPGTGVKIILNIKDLITSPDDTPKDEGEEIPFPT